MTMVKILWFMTIIMIHSHELPPQRTIIILLRVKVCLFWGVAASDKPQQFLIIVKDGSLRGKMIPISKWVNNHSRAQVFIYIYTIIYICICQYIHMYTYTYTYMCVCGVYEVYKPHIPPAVLMALWLDRSMTSPFLWVVYDMAHMAFLTSVYI